MPRKRGTRSQVLQDLRTLKAAITWLIGRWDVRTTVLLDDVQQLSDGTYSHSRPRREAEYPENRMEDWATLAASMRELSEAAERVAFYAQAQVNELRGQRS